MGPKRSPAMEQFFRAKQAYPDALLFFRMGDFYELFFEDAVLASQLLDLTLTSRGSDEHGVAIPMAGVPHHAASGYLARLIERGQRVAICEQMEDPSKVKGVVPREVVRVISPGLVLEPDALDARANNHLACLACDEQGKLALGVLELSTAEARCCALGSGASALAELVRLDAREILLDGVADDLKSALARALPRAVFHQAEASALERAHGDPRLAGVLSAAAADQRLGALPLRACAHCLAYAQASQPQLSLPVERITPYDPSDQLQLDEAAVRNLELVVTLSGEKRGALLHLIDQTKTSMGARLLRRRMLAPLTDVSAIRRRHDQVEALLADAVLRDTLRGQLARIADLDRLATRAALAVATPRDLGAIARSLSECEPLRDALAAASTRGTDDALAPLVPEDIGTDLRAELAAALVDEPPLSATAGGIFRAEHDPRVAELRALAEDSRGVILALEQREREQTGIGSLKVRYTRVFGYYIEISKAKLGTVPAHYRRKQTVAGGERFTTEELEGLQAKILNADERLRGLESELFVALRTRVAAERPRLARLAATLAELDVQAAFATLAHAHGYVRPVVDDSLALDLEESRHPIVERVVASGRFVPNDVALDASVAPAATPSDGVTLAATSSGKGARLMIITGPNMAGKSTVMRQVALCVLLAQAGSFVPARRARIGVVDRIYTRVGASDNVAQGQSTFMVEMREAAAILRGASQRSLVILDEIGRGTSTYDGLSIAWAVAEHLHDAIGCRSMFATHYHELCELAQTRPGAVNYNVAAKQVGDDVVFLHRLVPGGANRSYGIAVAQLAGVPEIVLARARTLLADLESGAALPSGGQASLRGRSPDPRQLEIFAPAPALAASPVESTLRELDIDRMTPVEALVALARLKQLLPRKD